MEYWTDYQSKKLLGLFYHSKTRLKLIAMPTEMLWRKFLSLKKNFVRAESKINIIKQVNTLLNKRVVDMERPCWTNRWYSRKKFWELIIIIANELLASESPTF